MDARGKNISAPKSNISRLYTLSEEIFNSVSHGVGVILSIAALALLSVWAVLYGDAYSIVSAAIYGTALILLYIMSTLYHALTNERAKKVFRIFDHCSIFLLIAGTYTPITLVTLRGPLGWTTFGILWTMAITGVVFNSVNMKKFKVYSLVCYIVMGWFALFIIRPLIDSIEKNGLILLFAGGAAYTLGITFYALKKFRYMHSIWHLFVLAGSVLHFFFILFYVLPVDKLA